MPIAHTKLKSMLFGLLVNFLGDNFMKDQKKKKILTFLYKSTHYGSYHAYKRSSHFLSYLLVTILVLAFYTIFTNIYVAHALSNFVLVLMIVYLLLYYFVQAKAKTMKRDSKAVLNQINLFKYINSSWNIYDGIYKSEDNDLSIEISFQHERPYLTNLWRLIRKYPKLIPPAYQDVLTLKKYIYDLQDKKAGDSNFVIYTTTTPEIESALKNANILLEELPKKYITKPSRFDYAADSQDWSKIFKSCKTGLKAYRLAVDPKEYEKTFMKAYNEENQHFIEQLKNKRKSKNNSEEQGN